MRTRWRRLLHDPTYVVLGLVFAAGLVIGDLVTREDLGETALALFGRFWRGTPEETREVLGAIFGLQFTVLTIVLSLNAPLVQSAANQYSPRLVPFYLKNAPIRRAVPMFVLATGYIFAAVRDLGVMEAQVSRPRPVVSGALLLVVAAFLLLAFDLLRTYRFMRVERVLGLVRESTFAAARRTQRMLSRLDLDGAKSLALPAGARSFGATESGYVVRTDVPRLARIARKHGVRVRVSRAIGDFVDAGEVVGWYVADAPGGDDPGTSERLGSTLEIAPTREPDHDPGYGIRILADVAARALSSSSNDSYTARQALQHVRSTLRQLARVPLGDWNVVDRDGEVRVSVMSTQLRELVCLAIDAPLRYGANDIEVLDAVLEMALEVGLVAPGAEGRALAHELVDRVLSDASHYGELDAGRRAHLESEAERVRASLELDAPRGERVARSDWALSRAHVRALSPRHS